MISVRRPFIQSAVLPLPLGNTLLRETLHNHPDRGFENPMIKPDWGGGTLLLCGGCFSRRGTLEPNLLGQHRGCALCLDAII